MSTLNETMDTARDVLDSAKQSTGHAVSSARSTMLDGVRTVTSVVAMLRDLGVADALGWVGLERRQSPLRSVALFGAGIAVGAGIGMLLAPMSGGDLRRAILRPLQDATDTVKKDARAVEVTAAKQVEAATKQVEAATRVVADAARAHSSTTTSPGNGHRAS